VNANFFNTPTVPIFPAMLGFCVFLLRFIRVLPHLGLFVRVFGLELFNVIVDMPVIFAKFE
jgi:hypothetical protein